MSINPSERIKAAMKHLARASARIERAMEAYNERVRAKRPPTVKMIDAMLAADEALFNAAFTLADETGDFRFLDKHRSRRAMKNKPRDRNRTEDGIRTRVDDDPIRYLTKEADGLVLWACGPCDRINYETVGDWYSPRDYTRCYGCGEEAHDCGVDNLYRFRRMLGRYFGKPVKPIPEEEDRLKGDTL